MKQKGEFAKMLQQTSEDSVPALRAAVYVIYLFLLLASVAASAFPLISYLIVK